jgi:DNA-binding transcriptional regulator GbsR (MarR family)
MRNIGNRQNHLAAEDIAEKLGASTSWVYSALREINDDLEQELVFRGYLEARDPRL